MRDYVGKKLQGDFTLQLLITRQPDDAHSAATENFDQGVATEQLLTGRKLALRHVRRAAGSLVAHPVRVMLKKTAIKPKTANVSLTPHTASSAKISSRSRFL